jgi:cell division protein FtsW (lipid II flippase)
MSGHRVLRIKSWLASSSEYMINLSTDKLLHENILLTTIDKLGIFAFILVILCFIFLSYIIISYIYAEKSHKIFAFGIVMLVLINLATNILYIFGLLPIYPATLYFFGYGNNIVIASSIIVGMLMMLRNFKDTNHEN